MAGGFAGLAVSERPRVVIRELRIEGRVEPGETGYGGIGARG